MEGIMIGEKYLDNYESLTFDGPKFSNNVKEFIQYMQGFNMRIFGLLRSGLTKK
jgi:hypothetical protein